LTHLTKALLALCLTGGAAASDLSFAATNTLKLAQFTDNGDDTPDNDDYARVLERLDVRGSRGDFTAAARMDLVLLFDTLPAGEVRDDDAPNEIKDPRLERVLVQYRGDGWRIDAFDQHLQLGRGIVLSLKPVDAAGVDVALRGGQVHVAGAGHQAALFAGWTNPVNFDAIVHRFVEDTNDLVAGGQYSVRPDGLPELGLLAAVVRVVPDEGEGGLRSTTYNGGVFIDGPGLTEWLDVYLELDGQAVKRGEAELDRNLGAYLGADLMLGETLMLVEGLYLDTYAVRGSKNSATKEPYAYNRPPTLERFDQEVFDYEHVQGGRVRAERPLGDPDTVGHANAMFRRQSPGESEVRQYHAYTGMEMQVPARLALSGGYRLERIRSSSPEGGPLNPEFEPFKTMAHGEFDYYLSLSGPHQLHLNGEVQFRTQPGDLTPEEIARKVQAPQLDHWRGTVLLGYEWGALLTVTADLGVDTQNQNNRNYFAAGIVTTRPVNWFDARLLVGTQRGGIRCIGGICRDFPSFAGARTELVARF